jgi:hypothetical protein
MELPDSLSLGMQGDAARLLPRPVQTVRRSRAIIDKAANSRVHQAGAATCLPSGAQPTLAGVDGLKMIMEAREIRPETEQR